MLMRFLVAAMICCLSRIAVAQPTTAFTYQGQLRGTGGPLTGAADFRFRLYNAATGGGQIGPEVAASNVAIDNGLFTTTLDFKAAFASASPTWLEIDVRSPAGAGAFTTLSPRTALTPTPLAQAISGIPMIADSGVPTINLQQTSLGSNGLFVQSFQPCWQSFTADKSGLLQQIDMYVTALSIPSSASTLKIYNGVGVGGTLLATATATPGTTGPLSFNGFSVAVTAGSKYTFAISGSNAFSSASAAIPGTEGRSSEGALNWWFRTYLAGPLLSAKVADSSLLNGKPPSAYQPPTAQNWNVVNLPASTIDPSTFKTITGTLTNINLGAGSAVISWSTSGRVTATGVYQFRVRLGTSTGPWTFFAFNQPQVHTTISGNAVIPVPSTGTYQISLELLGPASGSSYVIDQNDSLTASVLNVLQ